MIITLAGAIGSGKTTLGEALAAARHAPRAGFGDYVRHLAVARGLDITQRTVLQDLGHDLVEADASDFLAGALAWSGHEPGADLVLDGLRHMKILAALRDRAAKGLDRVVLVYLDTPLDLRRARVAQRGVIPTDIATDEAHPAERDLAQRLRDAADLVLPGDRTIEELSTEVQDYLDQR
jgi:dephospho-CoA kinase